MARLGLTFLLYAALRFLSWVAGARRLLLKLCYCTGAGTTGQAQIVKRSLRLRYSEIPKAETYEEWLRLAKELDEVEGLEAWKNDVFATAKLTPGSENATTQETDDDSTDGLWDFE